MRRPSAIPAITLVLLLAAFAPPAQAQPASVQGRVLDPSGQPVAGASVSLRSGAGLVRQTQGRADGSYSIDRVAPGSYELAATAEGFRAEPARITVGPADTLNADIHLALAAVTDAVVVSASYVELPQSEVTTSVTALSRRDIEDRQFTMVADALRLAPGMSVAPSGGLGSVTSVFPRGGESDYTLVMVDGVKLNSFGGGFDFGHLATFGFSQVEVVRGPQSAVFGSDAIGGVVHLRSRIGGHPSAYGLLETGSYGTSRFAAGTSGSKGTVDWGAAVERASSDGWTDEAPNPSLGRVTNDDYEASTVSLAAAWRASPRSVLRATTRFGTNERGNPGPFGSDPIGAYPGIDRVSRGTNDAGMGAIDFTHEWNPRTALRLQSSYLDERSRFVSPWGESNARTRRFQARGQVDRSLTPSLGATAGAALELESAGSSYITGSSAQQVPVDRRVAGYFAELRWRSSSRLFATAGLRVEDIVRGALEPDPLSFSPRMGLPEDRVVSVNPRAAVSYYLRTSDASGGNWSRVHGSLGTGIRPPDAFEIAFTDNPGLKPERSKSADAGFEQALAGGLVILDATWFLNRYDDLIVAVGRSMQDYSRYRTDNIANAQAQGLETSFALRTTWGLEARASYTFADTAVLAVDRAPGVAPAPFAVGDWLLRRPRHQVNVDLLWRHRVATAYVRAGGRSRVLDVEPNWGAAGGLYYAPGFGVADAGIAIHAASQVDVLLRADNLFDRQYEAVFGYPAPRRSFTVGVRLASGR
jgi:outer membrane cobalamin receptor